MLTLEKILSFYFPLGVSSTSTSGVSFLLLPLERIYLLLLLPLEVSRISSSPNFPQEYLPLLIPSRVSMFSFYSPLRVSFSSISPQEYLSLLIPSRVSIFPSYSPSRLGHVFLFNFLLTVSFSSTSTREYLQFCSILYIRQ